MGMSGRRGLRPGLACCWLLLMAAAGSGGPSRADAIPAGIFSHQMVLQRDRPLPVWGSGRPGEKVMVSFATSHAETVVTDAGTWQVVLPPQPASSEPTTLTIRGDRERHIEDVVVGEVWLCAGQSNMLFPLSRAEHAAQETAAAELPLVRLCPCRTAAGGDSPAYTAEQLERLVPDRFMQPDWERCTPATAGEFSAVGLFMARSLAEALEIPVGVICLAVGGSPTEAWISPAALAADPRLRGFTEDTWLENPLVGQWCRDRARQNLGRALATGGPIPCDETGPSHPFKPGFLWEAGIGRIAPFAIRGMAWYQGESNAETAELVAVHDRLLPRLVSQWRSAWGQDDLPFAIVQLPGMNRPHWPAFRESQRRQQAAIPGTGLIVTIDLGRRDEVHPADKQPIGERLAAWAAGVIDGTDNAGGSPRATRAERRLDGSVIVEFGDADGLTTSDGGPPLLFEVGRFGRFHAARAVINADAVIVTSDDASGPWDEVRYAWVPWPEQQANLVNTAGLPAGPFCLPCEMRAQPPACRGTGHGLATRLAGCLTE